ncbi:MAG: FtsX-like permease family protein [Longibaculum sp.]
MEKNKVFIKLMAKNKTNLYSIIITYFILIMFGFIFFELSSNTALKNINNLDYALFTPISLFINVLDLIALLVIVLCSLVLMEVYKGFIEKNLKENSIFRTCGYSSIRLSILYCFVFIVICIFILPFAIFGGYILTYILHFFLFKYLQINSSIYVIDNYIFIGIFLLTIVLITWVTLFTIGYFYRKNLLQLLNEARSENKESLPLIQISAKVHIFFFIIGWIDLIFSLLFNQLPISGIFLICITLKKINLIISNIMQNFFSKKNHITIVAISECKYFLQKIVGLFIYIKFQRLFYHIF